MPTPGPSRVLFVCLHGAAKSVLAAADLRRLAADRGLDLEAEAVGIEPELEIAPAVVRALLAEGVDLRDQRPRKVTPRDVQAATHVVAFGCEVPAAGSGAARLEQWTDVPAVSEDLATARAAIRRHLERLLDESTAMEAAR
jgi:arsenate reductase (thioredoxin)